jgi:methylenetetrahydrofolate dehydrogenase (NADP+)/methenyltetrahydrofolate cyclohydrolase
MAKIISGKELSAKLKLEMADEVKTFPAKYGRVPHLVVILVGEDPGSVSYVTGKAKASAEVGIRNTTIRKPESVSEAELLDIITALNLDDEVDGILVQLPLPKHIDEDKVIAAIDKQKDVDGFHPLNVAALWQKQPCTLPCTPKGILKMLRAAGVEIAGKRAVVIGRSNIVGLPVSERYGDDGPQSYAQPRRSDARGGDSGGGHRAAEVRHGGDGVAGRRGDRRGGEPRPGDGQTVR